MSFTNIKYDKCDQKTQLNESVASCSYYLNTPIITNKCLNPNFINQKGPVGLNKNSEIDFNFYQPDIESELMNINKPLTNCIKNKNNFGHDDSNKTNIPICDFPSDSTRLSNPPSTMRGIGINRFETLCLDPQAKIFLPQNGFNFDTKNYYKDNFVPCVRQPKINSMDPNNP